jgi:YggT family protein
MALEATLVGLLESLISLYAFVVIVAVIVSWLVAFNVINAHNPTVRAFLRALYGLTEPVFAPIRNRLPAIGGLDLSPLIVWIVLQALNFFLIHQFGDFRFF